MWKERDCYNKYWHGARQRIYQVADIQFYECHVAASSCTNLLSYCFLYAYLLCNSQIIASLQLACRAESGISCFLGIPFLHGGINSFKFYEYVTQVDLCIHTCLTYMYATSLCLVLLPGTDVAAAVW